MTLLQWLKHAASRLESAGVDSFKLDAQLLAGKALQKERSWILAHGDESVDSEVEQLESLLYRRIKREPLAYILGYREFYGRSYTVSPAVLIPRQETEDLIETILSYIPNDEPLKILDIGTGSGCIPITLKLERPQTEVFAVDISSEALELARVNAKNLHAEIQFQQSDLLNSLDQNSKFNFIVSNPPYIRNDFSMAPDIKLYEPHLALFGGEKGWEIYERLVHDAPKFLLPNGYLILEHGYDQKDILIGLFTANGWRLVTAKKDISGIDRILVFNH
jgi:release factor glutamine methyltransferase